MCHYEVKGINQSHSIKVKHNNILLNITYRQSQKKQSTTPVHHTKGDGETEVHTLRREKKALKDELEQTKAKQLNYEGAFQTEFDLRTTIEEKYDSLRERYEVRQH